MAMSKQEQEAFLEQLGLTQSLEDVTEPEPVTKTTAESPDDLEIDWGMIEGLSLTSKSDYEAAYRVIFDHYKRHRKVAPGWNSPLSHRIYKELNTRRKASTTDYVKEKVKAGAGDRRKKMATDIATQIAEAFKAQGMDVDVDALLTHIKEGE